MAVEAFTVVLHSVGVGGIITPGWCGCGCGFLAELAGLGEGVLW